MMRGHGMKVIRLTAVDHADVVETELERRLKKIYCDKSAEIIVPIYELVWEGLNPEVGH